MSPLAMKRAIPATPRVISPSPDPSDLDVKDQSGYMGPTTRSAARRRSVAQHPTPDNSLDKESGVDTGPGVRRARTRSRSPMSLPTPNNKKRASVSRSIKTLESANGHPQENGFAQGNGHARENSHAKAEENGQAAADAEKTADGYLEPPRPLMLTSTFSGWSWRDFSRSPSPLGLIPIHRQWRTFVHKHEVPRKVLHVSIGFFVVWLYLSGVQTTSVCPYLMAALIPISVVDVLRHHYAPFNRFYVRVLGALMRESEFSGYNGVIFYLLGAWTALRFFPKDVGVVSVLLLSWCDTAASTFGRLYGRYTPRIRRGKSLAGSGAAFLTGVGTAAWFWGWLAPSNGPFPGDENFMFKGILRLPEAAASAVGMTQEQAAVSGGLALGLMSLWSGSVAATSEVVDFFGWDDNLTIPILSGLAIWGFLKVFG